MVTPVTRLPPSSPDTASHSLVRSRTILRVSFWAMATVTNGCGRSPMASGFSFKRAATSVGSDLYSRVTSSVVIPFAFNKY